MPFLSFCYFKAPISKWSQSNLKFNMLVKITSGNQYGNYCTASRTLYFFGECIFENEPILVHQNWLWTWTRMSRVLIHVLWLQPFKPTPPSLLLKYQSSEEFLFLWRSSLCCTFISLETASRRQKNLRNRFANSKLNNWKKKRASFVKKLSLSLLLWSWY